MVAGTPLVRYTVGSMRCDSDGEEVFRQFQPLTQIAECGEDERRLASVQLQATRSMAFGFTKRSCAVQAELAWFISVVTPANLPHKRAGVRIQRT